MRLVAERPFPYKKNGDETAGHGSTLFNLVRASVHVSFDKCPDSVVHLTDPALAKVSEATTPQDGSGTTPKAGPIVGTQPEKVKENTPQSAGTTPKAGPTVDTQPEKQKENTPQSAKDVALCWNSIQPLDHLDDCDSRTIHLAVSRIPPASGINEAHPDWKGFSYWDFGGPGFSTILDGWRSMYYIQKLFPDYTIILRDHRGSGASGPQTNCWDSPWDEYLHQAMYKEDGSMINGGLSAAQRLRKQWLEFGERCSKRLGGNDGVLKHIGLAAHARDLHSLHTKLCTAYNVTVGSETGLLNFWGVSWGATLGHTLAVMYPDLVGRFVLDSGLDLSVPRNSSARYLTQLQNYEDAVTALEKLCNDAGDKCKLAGRFRQSMVSIALHLSRQAPFATRWDQYRLSYFLSATSEAVYNQMQGRLSRFVKDLDRWEKNLEQLRQGRIQPGQVLNVKQYDVGKHRLLAGGAWKSKVNPDELSGYSGWLIKCADAEEFGLVDRSSMAIHMFFTTKAYKATPKAPIKTRNPVFITGVRLDPVCPQRKSDGTPYGTQHYQQTYYLEIDGVGHSVRSQLPWPSTYETVLMNYIQDGTVPKDQVVPHVLYPFQDAKEETTVVAAAEDALAGALDDAKEKKKQAVDSAEDAFGGALDDAKKKKKQAVDSAEDAFGGALDDAKKKKKQAVDVAEDAGVGAGAGQG
ncbi:hypothetical protein BJ508DRAFT_306305 [Ascobolus immersus RN42]|uniref:AB hydrolase-1 domain-containing protein n=1 Tax=Ascobolus immersus RN42 TaxID=1160509 RepID=A0A3N4I6I9_ASCIM|nr:hypothetical protein BJ508DRAFT_306305 [Ascobolus immersus RN42]